MTCPRSRTVGGPSVHSWDLSSRCLKYITAALTMETCKRQVSGGIAFFYLFFFLFTDISSAMYVPVNIDPNRQKKGSDCCPNNRFRLDGWLYHSSLWCNGKGLWLNFSERTRLWSSFMLNLMSVIVIFQKRVQVKPPQLRWRESLFNPVVRIIKQLGEPGQDVKSIWPSIYRWGSAFVMVIRQAAWKATSAADDFCKLKIMS